MEASCTNNIHTGEEVFAVAILFQVCELFHFRKSKKTCGIVWSV